MKTIFRAVFYLRSNYVNKEGKTPVMLRIYLNNERLSIGSTGIAVQQSQWDSEKERLKGRTTEILSTNLELDNIQSGHPPSALLKHLLYEGVSKLVFS